MSVTFLRKISKEQSELKNQLKIRTEIWLPNKLPLKITPLAMSKFTKNN